MFMFIVSIFDQIFIEYENMFGYRLKMLVDDPEEIENMMTKVSF